MALKLKGYVDLPAHTGPSGFDHAAVHSGRKLLYAAHTANDALDIIDCEKDVYLQSIAGLSGVAGALVSEASDLVFTSNRGEDSVGIFSAGDPSRIKKVRVGMRPNGLAFDPRRGYLLAANVGNPQVPGSFTLSIVDVSHFEMIASIPVSSRTRWTIYEPKAEVFFVNVAAPPQIVLVDPRRPTAVSRHIDIPVEGPHGLDLDPDTRRLFCACDAAQLITLDADTGRILGQVPLSGTPDVIFFNRSLRHLYVAIGDPGVIDVFDTTSMSRLESVATEKGAHTLGFDAARNKVYAFLPESHRAAVYVDS